MRIPAHPGKILKREIAVRNMSANRLALDLGVPATRISEILRGRRGITPETRCVWPPISGVPRGSG